MLFDFQGIVMEKSPYSEHVYVEAAYKQGWIDKTSRIYFYKVNIVSSFLLLTNFGGEGVRLSYVC